MSWKRTSIHGFMKFSVFFSLLAFLWTFSYFRLFHKLCNIVKHQLVREGIQTSSDGVQPMVCTIILIGCVRECFSCIRSRRNHSQPGACRSYFYPPPSCINQTSSPTWASEIVRATKRMHLFHDHSTKYCPHYQAYPVHGLKQKSPRVPCMPRCASVDQIAALVLKHAELVTAPSSANQRVRDSLVELQFSNVEKVRCLQISIYKPKCLRNQRSKNITVNLLCQQNRGKTTISASKRSISNWA